MSTIPESLASAAAQKRAEELLWIKEWMVLDDDLAALWDGVVSERRTGIERTVAVQQVRLLRQLLEKLDYRDDRSEGALT